MALMPDGAAIVEYVAATYRTKGDVGMLLPTVAFYGAQITRMIVGDNPVNGHSYIEDRISGQEMSSFYTPEKTVEMFFRAEKIGFNTLLPLACPKSISALKEYRRQGGSMHIIFQPYPAVSLEKNIDEMMELSPIAIYHQGTTTDYLTETDGWDVLHANLALLRATGLPVGLATHVPETVLRAEAENWGVDFYMTCLYNARRNRRGQQSGFITGKSKSQLIFYPEDRFDMYRVIQQVQKPFIAYKILAGGQVFTGKQPHEFAQVAQTYIKEAYDSIKPGDVTCIGVLQRDGDQLEENARILRGILASQ